MKVPPRIYYIINYSPILTSSLQHGCLIIYHLDSSTSLGYHTVQNSNTDSRAILS